MSGFLHFTPYVMLIAYDVVVEFCCAEIGHLQCNLVRTFFKKKKKKKKLSCLNSKYPLSPGIPLGPNFLVLLFSKLFIMLIGLICLKDVSILVCSFFFFFFFFFFVN
jgi:hypothetical protein